MEMEGVEKVETSGNILAMSEAKDDHLARRQTSVFSPFIRASHSETVNGFKNTLK